MCETWLLTVEFHAGVGTELQKGKANGASAKLGQAISLVSSGPIRSH